MAARVEQGTIIMRVWEHGKGLDESGQSFGSLDELFGYCIQANDPAMVDRIVLTGTDDQGKARTLVFVFQSITAAEGL